MKAIRPKNLRREQIVRVDFACNDPDNGMFTGRVMMASYGEAELECDNWLRGYVFTVGESFIRLHRRKYPIVKEKYGIGNWCWNGYFMKRSEAKRLITDLRASGRWCCTAAPTHFYNWFNKEEAA